MEVTARRETALEAFPAYQRMGDDQMRLGHLVEAELMRQFYLHLKAGLNKAEALRQAQLAMLQRRTQPYYWAAYELIGEAR